MWLSSAPLGAVCAHFLLLSDKMKIEWLYCPHRQVYDVEVDHSHDRTEQWRHLTGRRRHSEGHAAVAAEEGGGHSAGHLPLRRIHSIQHPLWVSPHSLSLYLSISLYLCVCVRAIRHVIRPDRAADRRRRTARRARSSCKGRSSTATCCRPLEN